MKNVNISFKEARLLYMSPGNAGPEFVSEEQNVVSEKAKNFIDGLNKSPEFANLNADKILADKENPYLLDLLNFVRDLKSSDFESVTVDAGNIVIQYNDETILNASNDQSKSVLKALLWPEINAVLTREFKTKNKTFTAQDYESVIYSDELEKVTDEVLFKILRNRGVKSAQIDAVDAGLENVSDNYINDSLRDIWQEMLERHKDAKKKLWKDRDGLLVKNEFHPAVEKLAQTRDFQRAVKNSGQSEFTFEAKHPEYGVIFMAVLKIEKNPDGSGTVKINISKESTTKKRTNRKPGDPRGDEVSGSGDEVWVEDVKVIDFTKPDNSEITVTPNAIDALAEVIGSVDATSEEFATIGATQRALHAQQIEQKHYNLEHGAAFSDALGGFTEADLATNPLVFKDGGKQVSSLDGVEMSKRRRTFKINPDRWEPFTREGRAELRRDWVMLGLPAREGESVYYDKVFNQLRKCNDEGFLNGLTLQGKNQLRDWYADPENHIDDLRTADPDFGKAWDFYQAVKRVMKEQDELQKGTEKGLEDVDGDKIFKGGANFIKKNIDAIRRAAHNRDYATLGMYALGFYALYKVFGDLKDRKIGGFEAKKVFFWLAAGYVGIQMGKNAGFDVMKKLGVKGQHAEIADTPMNFLPSLVPRAEEIDGNVLLKCAWVPMSTLYEAYKASNKDGIHQINPKRFPELAREFPEFRGKTTKELEKDPTYKHVSEQLYLIASCFEEAYDKTLRQDESKPNYKGKSLGEALQRPPIDSASLADFAMEFRLWTTDAEDQGILSAKALDNFRDRLTVVAEGSGLGLTVTEALKSNKSVLEGRVMGYPVVFRQNATANGYDIFSKEEFEKTNGVIQSGEALGFVPNEGEIDAGSIEGKVTDKVKILLSSVQFNGQSLDTAVQYDKGKDKGWVFIVKVPGNPAFDIKEEETQAAVVFENATKNGTGFKLVIDGVEIDPKSNVNVLQAAVDNKIISKLIEDSDFAVLAPVQRMGGITIVEKHSNGVLKLKIGKTEFATVYKKAAAGGIGNFKETTKTAQKAVISTPEFQDLYVRGLIDHSGFTDTVNELLDVIDGSNGPLISHIPSGFLQMISEGRLNTSHLEGVPRDYAKSKVRNKREFLRAYISNKLQSAETFQDISSNEKMLGNAQKELDRISRDISLHVEKWKPEDFMLVLGQIDQIALRGKGPYPLILRHLEEKLQAKQGKILTKQGRLDIEKKLQTFLSYTAHLDHPMLDQLRYPPDMLGYPWLRGKLANATSPTTDLAEYFSGNLAKPNDGDVKAKLVGVTSSLSKITDLLPYLSSELADFSIYLDGNWISADDFYKRPAYFKYVEEEIIRGTATIESFDSWKGKNIISPINSLDNDPPLTNTTRSVVRKASVLVGTATKSVDILRTEIEQVLESKLLDLAQIIKTKGGVISGRVPNINAIDNYISLMLCTTANIQAGNIGDPSGSPLETKARQIAARTINRSDQEQAMLEEIEKQKRVLLTDPKFWKGLDWSDRFWMTYESIF